MFSKGGGGGGGGGVGWGGVSVNTVIFNHYPKCLIYEIDHPLFRRKNI